MSLKLYLHPLSSYCHKVLIALYENATPFEPVIVNPGDQTLVKLWPIAKFPVLEDEARKHAVAESSIIIEYLDQKYPGPVKFIPADPDRARETRLWDRFFDLHIHHYVQSIVGNRIRPADQKDPHGLAQYHAKMKTGLDFLEQNIGSDWMMGKDFTLADCAAAPALFYADKITPLAPTHPKATAYLERLKARPSYARALKEAEPYFQYFPTK